MTVGENVGFDRHPLAEGSLAGKPATLYLGGDGFDHHPAPAVRQGRHRGVGLRRSGGQSPLDGGASHDQIVTIGFSSPLRGEVARSNGGDAA